MNGCELRSYLLLVTAYLYPYVRTVTRRTLNLLSTYLERGVLVTSNCPNVAQ